MVLPRQAADAYSQVSWPKCLICRRNVDAYGVENETDRAIEVWARCDGVQVDPSTGLTVGHAPRKHEMLKSSVTIRKGPGWSSNRLTDILRRLTFFAPAGEGTRDVEQTLTAEGLLH
jgi:hypothetical protein